MTSDTSGSSFELPPGQQWAAPGKWPVVGERAPEPSDQPWTVSVCGLVSQARCWSLEELQAMPQTRCSVDVHCVTRWSKPGMRFEGVSLRHLLEQAEPLPEARFVSFVARSRRRHSTSLTREDVERLEPLVALRIDGVPLPVEHGGPVRIVVPQRYFYKSLKWLQTIELLAEDRLGYWEREAGYHNRADPWREERYLAADLDRRTVRRLLQTRDMVGLELRGLDVSGHELEQLNARGAVLRNAHFENSRLRRACFDGANLANAHFQQADLREASFREADLEGTNFVGADLRGVDLRGASLFGATFCSPPEWSDPPAAARIDGSTRFDETALESLAALPHQYEFVRRQTASDSPGSTARGSSTD